MWCTIRREWGGQQGHPFTGGWSGGAAPCVRISPIPVRMAGLRPAPRTSGTGEQTLQINGDHGDPCLGDNQVGSAPSGPCRGDPERPWGQTGVHLPLEGPSASFIHLKTWLLRGGPEGAWPAREPLCPARREQQSGHLPLQSRGSVHTGLNLTLSGVGRGLGLSTRSPGVRCHLLAVTNPTFGGASLQGRVELRERRLGCWQRGTWGWKTLGGW